MSETAPRHDDSSPSDRRNGEAEWDAHSLPALPQRSSDTHKSDCGKLLLIGGSTGMAGAIGLTGMAALRSGAGLVTIATPDDVAPIVAGFHPCSMTLPVAGNSRQHFTAETLELLLARSAESTCVAVGPGMGRTAATLDVVVELYRQIPCPAVFDADALFALSTADWQNIRIPAARILTPHLGEFRRLCRQPEWTMPTARQKSVPIALKTQTIIVVKGHRTLVTNGHTTTENPSGNPGMASGGMGDVLTGVIAALLGQGMPPLDAAQLGVYLHGLAGDLAASDLGLHGLLATDVIDYLPAAFLKHLQREPIKHEAGRATG